MVLSISSHTRRKRAREEPPRTAAGRQPPRTPARTSTHTHTQHAHTRIKNHLSRPVHPHPVVKKRVGWKRTEEKGESVVSRTEGDDDASHYPSSVLVHAALVGVRVVVAEGLKWREPEGEVSSRAGRAAAGQALRFLSLPISLRPFLTSSGSSFLVFAFLCDSAAEISSTYEMREKRWSERAAWRRRERQGSGPSPTALVRGQRGLSSRTRSPARAQAGRSPAPTVEELDGHSAPTAGRPGLPRPGPPLQSGRRRETAAPAPDALVWAKRGRTTALAAGSTPCTPPPIPS